MAPTRVAAYNLSEFLKACDETARGVKENVWLLPGIEEKARREFELINGREIFEYLASKDLVEFRHFNTVPYDKDPRIDIDSYTFSYGNKIIAYVGFYLAPITKNWFLKSFHKSLTTPLTQKPFGALGNFLKEEEEREEGEK